MQARWMDPNAGTFLSIDPVVGDAFDPQSVNAYSYARNNPVSYTDPTGMSSIGDIITLISHMFSNPDGLSVGQMIFNGPVAIDAGFNAFGASASRSGGIPTGITSQLSGAGGGGSPANELPPNVVEAIQSLTDRIDKAEGQIAEAEEAIAANLEEIGSLTDYISDIDEQILGKKRNQTAVMEGIVRGATEGQSSVIEQFQSSQAMARSRIETLESENRRTRAFIVRRRADVSFFRQRRQMLLDFFGSQH
jgi:hypothetical protein